MSAHCHWRRFGGGQGLAALPQGPARFVWDFTRTESARTVDSVTTNAVVTAVLVETEPIVGGTTVIFM